jgi:hypothetical protein
MRRSKSCGVGGYFIFAGRQQVEPKFSALIGGSVTRERSTNRSDLDLSGSHPRSACVLDGSSKGAARILGKCTRRLNEIEEDRKQ